MQLSRNCQMSRNGKMASKSKTVQKLSAKKQKRSLGEVSKLEKDKAKTKAANRKFSRTTVINPLQLEWPSIVREDEEEVLKRLNTDLECLKPPNLHVPLNVIQKIPKEERRNFRRKWQSEKSIELGFDTSAYTKLKLDLSLGTNCVSVALEQKLLNAVIIEKDVEPQLITKLLVPMAVSKGIPIIAVNGLNRTCQQVFKTRCLALGFKVNCSAEDHPFHQLLQLVTSISKRNTNSSPSNTLVSCKVRKCS